MAVVDQQSASHVLECMEIWGGNHAANAGASTAGLDLWVSREVSS